MNRFTFALFHFYTLRLLNWDVWKNYQNIYFRIIIIVSFLRMQCAFWQRGWPLRLFEISFEATEARVYVAVNGPSKWLNELFEVRTTRGASVHVSYEFFFHDGRKYKSFEGLQLVFWPLDFWPLAITRASETSGSSEWLLRITAKKWLNAYMFY